MYPSTPLGDGRAPHRGRRWAKENYGKSNLINPGKVDPKPNHSGDAESSIMWKLPEWMRYLIRYMDSNKAEKKRKETN